MQIHWSAHIQEVLKMANGYWYWQKRQLNYGGHLRVLSFLIQSILDFHCKDLNACGRYTTECDYSHMLFRPKQRPEFCALSNMCMQAKRKFSYSPYIDLLCPRKPGRIKYSLFPMRTNVLSCSNKSNLYLLISKLLYYLRSRNLFKL